MYVPTLFNQSDLATLHAFIERHSFALLCSTGEDGPVASHLPFLVDRQAGERGALRAHLARANPHWRLADGKRVLVVFSGPHAYVSPTWYEASNVVPTWNYQAVHVTGTFQIVEGAEALATLRDLVAYFEAGQPRPWSFDLAPDYLERQLRGIVAFRIAIDTIEGKWKLGQNQPVERRARAARALRQQGGEKAEAIADLMERTLPSVGPRAPTPDAEEGLGG